MNLKTFKSFFLLLSIVLLSTLKGQAQTLNSSEYVEKYKGVAQEMMLEYGVPASVILAIAMHESANGGSRVAKHLNNHFGIKGKNNSKTIRSAYKGYDSVLNSYDDFVGLLKRRKSYATLFDTHYGEDFQAWVKGIARGGYSQSAGWSSKVLATIKRFNLDELDKPISSRIAAKADNAKEKVL